MRVHVAQVRFTAQSFSVAGDHSGQTSHGHRWPFGPVALITARPRHNGRAVTELSLCNKRMRTLAAAQALPPGASVAWPSTEGVHSACLSEAGTHLSLDSSSGSAVTCDE